MHTNIKLGKVIKHCELLPSLKRHDLLIAWLMWGHVVNWKMYISSFTILTVTKFGRMLLQGGASSGVCISRLQLLVSCYHRIHWTHCFRSPAGDAALYPYPGWRAKKRLDHHRYGKQFQLYDRDAAIPPDGPDFHPLEQKKGWWWAWKIHAEHPPAV